ncbi:hypothetical protein S83_047504, partial [Arachis hypogaea]
VVVNSGKICWYDPCSMVSCCYSIASDIGSELDNTDRFQICRVHLHRWPVHFNSDTYHVMGKKNSWIFELLKGFLGGIILVFSIHAVNAFLGCATFSWPCSPSSLDAVTCFKVYGKMILVVVQGTVMASGIDLVEELLFRSWFPQEIAVDLGYFHGVIISGLVPDS